MNLPPILAVRDLSKGFGALRALDGVSFTIAPGEIVGLIGPNGAGKTTLLECIAGLLAADPPHHPEPGEGPSSSHPILRFAQDDGHFYVPDGITPWEGQRVAHVLQFFDDFHGSAPHLRDQLIRELLLTSLLSQRIGTLSRGERKRVLLALGLLTPAPLLLLDEPFEGFDVRQARDIAAVLRTHAGMGRTLFMSIHQLHDATRVCDRMILLSGGRIVGIGTLDQLRQQTALRTGDLEDVFLALT